MILTGALMWLVARSPFGYPTVVPYTAETGTVFIVLGIAIIAAGMTQFARAKTTVNPIDLTESTALVTGGIYEYTRNPMYLGMVFILLGWGLHLDSLINILCIALFLIIITAWQIKPEEAALRKLFDDEYEAYCRRVRRWL